MMFRNGMLLIFILWVNFTWAGCRTTASLNITDSINVGEILANEVSFSKSVVFTGISCDTSTGNDSNLLIVFYVQIMPDDFVMQLHRF